MPAIEDDSYGLFSPLFTAMGAQGRDLWRRVAIKALLANSTWCDGNPFFCKSRLLADETDPFTNGVATAFSDVALNAAITALRSAQVAPIRVPMCCRAC